MGIKKIRFNRHDAAMRAKKREVVKAVNRGLRIMRKERDQDTTEWRRACAYYSHKPVALWGV